MAKKEAQPRIPNWSIYVKKGIPYFRIQTYDADGKRFDIYGRSEEEVKQKYLQAQQEVEAAKFRKLNPTVKEYSEKWLEMHSALIQPSTLKGYTLAVKNYIVKPLGDMYMSDVTADDIKLAMVAVSKRSSATYNLVNMLFKSIFYSAEYSNLIKDNLPPYLFVMIGLYSGLRREEILGLQWDCVFLDVDTPYIAVRRAWHSEHNRPVITRELKTPAAKRDVPIPQPLVDCLRAEKEKSTSEYVIADKNGEPLSYSQFNRIWNYIRVRGTQERTLYKYVNGQAIQKKFKPEPGQKCVNRENIVYCLDFKVTPHQLRHTYITNLIHAGVDPKTVQYLAGHENSKVTMDIYAKAEYNRPAELSEVVNSALNTSNDNDESGASSK